MITINGAPIAFPPELEQQAKSMADSAIEAGCSAVKILRGDPDQQIAAYFTKVYRSAYLDGFFRAMLFQRHEKKGGRLRRIRELWKKCPRPGRAVNGLANLEFDSTWTPEDYSELERLIMLGDTGDDDAASSSDQHPPVSAGQAHVP